MTESHVKYDQETAIAQLEDATRDEKLSTGAVDNIRRWLTEPRYSEYAGEVAQHLADQRWQELDDAFWTVIPFGTGGRRGRMYPIGSNAFNDRTIGESAQGLADYMKSRATGELSCAIAYDTRHRSRHFAELCSSIMVAAGFKVYFLDDYRATPELSYLVRLKNCTCGIMVTASHNPPSDNAVKAYGASGGQLVPPDDEGVIQQVDKVDEIQRADFAKAVQDGQVVMCNEEVDPAYITAVVEQSFQGLRDLKVVYSPLHGVGEFAVIPVLNAAGFNDVEVFELHREPNGDFPNVPQHVSNPENPAVFDPMIERCQEIDAHLALATDPDCDRMGAAAPLTIDTSGPWATLNGNQLGALLADYVLEMRKQVGTLSPDHYVVKTLVTTDLIRHIADSYGVQTHGNLHVGFKWIGEEIDRAGPDKFVFGTEESHGFMVGQYVRDKDGAAACMLMSELAAKLKADGKSVHQRLDELYEQRGYHAESLLNVFMEGSDGMKRMQALMGKLRNEPLAELAGMKIATRRDYLNQTTTSSDGSSQPLDGPVGNMLIFDFAELGNYFAVRPSGTEPKVKFYSFTYTPPGISLDSSRSNMAARIDSIESVLRTIANSV